MSRSRLPLETSDYILDLLCSEPETLKACCLVSKSWFPRARKQLFREVQFDFIEDVDAWKETFPDPANSPARYTRSLSIYCAEVIPTAVAEEGGWIQAFSNVVCLRVRGTRYFRFRLLPQLLTRP